MLVRRMKNSSRLYSQYSLEDYSERRERVNIFLTRAWYTRTAHVIVSHNIFSQMVSTCTKEIRKISLCFARGDKRRCDTEIALCRVISITTKKIPNRNTAATKFFVLLRRNFVDVKFHWYKFPLLRSIKCNAQL